MIFNLSDKTKKIKASSIDLIKIVSLLVHAAKIDENYSEKERQVIIEFIKSYANQLKNIDKSLQNLNHEKVLEVIAKAEEYESSSNQILEFTKEIKKMNENLKTDVLKALWKVILSDNKSDMYESTLMRRICGLLYVSDKLSGEIKLNVLKGKKE